MAPFIDLHLIHIKIGQIHIVKIQKISLAEVLQNTLHASQACKGSNRQDLLLLPLYILLRLLHAKTCIAAAPATYCRVCCKNVLHSVYHPAHICLVPDKS